MINIALNLPLQITIYPKPKNIAGVFEISKK